MSLNVTLPNATFVTESYTNPCHISIFPHHVIICLAMSFCFRLIMSSSSPGRYVLNIHFFIESGQKMIQFNIPFKTKSKIFIQKNYSFKKIPNYPFKENIHSSEKRDYHTGLRTTIAQKQHFSPKTQFLG